VCEGIVRLQYQSRSGGCEGLANVPEEISLWGVRTTPWLKQSGEESWRKGNLELRLLCPKPCASTEASLLWRHISSHETKTS
jgi:hypothetical protein